MTKTQLAHKIYRAAWLRAGLGVLLIALTLGAQPQTNAAAAQPAGLQNGYGVPGLGAAPLAPNAAGALDATFGTGGKVTTDFFNSIDDKGYGIGLQSDGKVVVAGSTVPSGSETDVALARYTNSNGALDTTFDTDGKIVNGYGNGSVSIASAVAIQTDGKIVVAGTSSGFVGTASFELRRYLASNGAGDTAIDGDGRLITDFSAGSMPSISSSGAEAVAIQPADGKIVLVGSVQNGSEFHDFAVARYCPFTISSDPSLWLDDGANCPSLAPGFDTNGALGPLDGTVVTAIDSQTDDYAYAVAVQPADGKIVVVGVSQYKFAMVRYNTNGSLDTTFGTNGNGIVVDASVAAGRAVAIQPNGKIVVAATKSVTNNNTPNCIGSDGHICSDYQFYVARYNTNGTLDSTFGTGGAVTTLMNSQGNADQAYALAIQPDGKIVVAGTTDNGINEYPHTDPWINYHHNYDFALARYCSNGALDNGANCGAGGFGTGGKVSTNFTDSLGNNLADNGRAVAIRTDGKIVVAGYNESDFELARYSGDPKLLYLPLIRR